MKKTKSQEDSVENPRISLKSALYCYGIYKRAAGRKRFLFGIYRIYSAILPSITAVIAGKIITLISEAIHTKDYWPFASLTIALLIIQIIDALLDRVIALYSSIINQDLATYVASMVAIKYINTPLAVREDKDFADRFDRVREFGSSIPYVMNSLFNIVSIIIALISVVIATITVSPIMALIVVVATIPYSVLSLNLAKKQRINWRQFTKDRRIAWQVEQKIMSSNSALEIELNGLSRHLVDLMVRSRRRSQEQDIKDQKRYFWPSFGGRSFDTIISYSVLIYVAVEIINERLPIGQFLTVRNLFSQLSGNIRSLFSSIASASENLVNATDYMEFMSREDRPNGNEIIATLPKIEFRNVSFRYPHTKKWALKDINFVLNPGDSMAIVGENGAGKTTLIKLMIGAYEATEGEVLINDVPIRNIKRESYLDQIGALFQDFSRYEFATLGQNVWFGDITQKYNKKKVLEALSDAGLDNLADKLEDGLEQVLSKDLIEGKSADLSGGQWQRIGIARAFYRKPNILILDEPTSAVDAKSEYQIFQNIIKNQVGKTTVIISHRFSTVRKAEQIIVLEEGKITERGTHDELVAKNGVYSEMFKLQAEGYN